MNPTPPPRHHTDHLTHAYASQSQSNTQRVNTIATLPGLVPAPAVQVTNEGGC